MGVSFAEAPNLFGIAVKGRDGIGLDVDLAAVNFLAEPCDLGIAIFDGRPPDLAVRQPLRAPLVIPLYELILEVVGRIYRTDQPLFLRHL